MPILSRPLSRRGDPTRREAGPPMSPELEAFAARFEPRVRREVRQLMRAHERFADLARVFPGAAVQIVSPAVSLADRRGALDLVCQGAPLKLVARMLALPLWLRKLPPEAFLVPLGEVPQGEAFARRISARIPDGAADAAFWLGAICFAAKACHEEFAIWLAEQPIFDEGGEPSRLLSILAAYAWYSGQPQTRAGSLIVVPWRPQIAFDTAICAAKSWFNRLRLVLLLGKSAIGDTWLAPGEAHGFSFEPLTDAAGLLAEAQGMQNCADQYADKLAKDRCRLYSVRRGAVRAATLEIGPHPRESGVLAITQLKARHNMPAPLEVWQAAFAWMATQAGLRRIPTAVLPDRPADNPAWRQLLATYRQAKDGAPWLPEAMTSSQFSSIDSDMAELARKGGVTSWLFT